MIPGNSDYENIIFADDFVVKVVSPGSWMHAGIAKYPRHYLVDPFVLSDGFDPFQSWDSSIDTYEYSEMDPDKYLHVLINRAVFLDKYYQWLGEQTFEFDGEVHNIGELLLRPQFVIGTIYENDPRPYIWAVQRKINGLSLWQLNSRNNARGNTSQYRDCWPEVERYRRMFDAMLEQNDFVIPDEFNVPESLKEIMDHDMDGTYGNLMFETDTQDNLVFDENGKLKVYWIDI